MIKTDSQHNELLPESFQGIPLMCLEDIATSPRREGAALAFELICQRPNPLDRELIRLAYNVGPAYMNELLHSKRSSLFFRLVDIAAADKRQDALLRLFTMACINSKPSLAFAVKKAGLNVSHHSCSKGLSHLLSDSSQKGDLAMVRFLLSHTPAQAVSMDGTNAMNGAISGAFIFLRKCLKDGISPSEQNKMQNYIECMSLLRKKQGYFRTRPEKAYEYEKNEMDYRVELMAGFLKERGFPQFMAEVEKDFADAQGSYDQWKTLTSAYLKSPYGRRLALVI